MGWDPHERELSRPRQALALWHRIFAARLGLRTRETTQTDIAGHGILQSKSSGPRSTDIPPII
jgi:hypothetical protein